MIAKRDCFRKNREERIRLAERMANVTFSVVSRACERLLIGKTFWKSVVLPGVLNASEVMVWNEREKERLQRIENGVWRKVMRAASFTPVVALQGEVGCSTVRARDMKGKLKFAMYCVNAENVVLRKIIERVRMVGRMNGWMRMIEKYMGELGIDWGVLCGMNATSINGMVNDWENERWRREVESRSTLSYYRMKQEIGGVRYDNGWGAVLMFRARSNTLRLGWRGRFVGGDVGCVICGAGRGGGDVVSFSGGMSWIGDG